MLILLLIKPAFLQILYELRMIPLESSQQILDELAPAVLKLLKFLGHCGYFFLDYSYDLPLYHF